MEAENICDKIEKDLTMLLEEEETHEVPTREESALIGAETEEEDTEMEIEEGEEDAEESKVSEDGTMEQEGNEDDQDEGEEEEMEDVDDIFDDLWEEGEDDEMLEREAQEQIQMRMGIFQVILARARMIRGAERRQNWRFGGMGNQLTSITQDELQAILEKDNVVKIADEPLRNHPIFTRERGKELIYFSSEKIEEDPEEGEEEQEENNQADQRETRFNFYCIILNAKSGKIISKRKIEFENEETREDFYFLQNSRSRSAISHDKKRVVFYLFQCLLEYSIEDNKLSVHNAKEVNIHGDEFRIEADCMNQDYDDYLIIELYNDYTPSGDLVFYKYNIKSKQYYKLYHLRHQVNQRFLHSYCKIDRDALHGHEDCMFIFKYCAGQYGETDVYLFYVNLVTKRSLYKAKFVVDAPEAYYRAAIYQPFLWNDSQKFITRIGPKSILVFQKYNRQYEIFRSKDEIEFRKFVGIFDKKHKEVLEKKLRPREGFKFLEFQDKVLLMSDFGFSNFSTAEFDDLEDYAIVTNVFDNDDQDHYFLQLPFAEANSDKIKEGGKIEMMEETS